MKVNKLSAVILAGVLACSTPSAVFAQESSAEEILMDAAMDSLLSDPDKVADKALGRDIYGVDVASDGTITRKVAQSRVWQDKFYLYPIPEEEVWKIGQDFQNDGWK